MNTVSVNPKHALLRDRAHWEWASTTRLQQTAAGELTLVRFPAVPADAAVDLPGPWQSAPSGLALAANGTICISDTLGDQVICVDPWCGARTRLVGYGMAQPRGLLIVGDDLYVADSGNARIQIFDLKTFELRAVWSGSFARPVALAVDRALRVYVLDGGLQTILRLSITGDVDEVYNHAIAEQIALAVPRSIALDEHDILYVAEGTANRVFRFDPDGRSLGSLTALKVAVPSAMTVGGKRLYVADDASGEVLTFALDLALDLGALPGFRGPVTALYVDSAGGLRIKTDLALSVVSLHPDLGCVARGDLIAGPLDAGMMQIWERAVITATQPRSG
jgi:NHL repeat